MRLHIESDGTVHGTRLLDENGETIERVTHIVWSIDAHSRASAVIVFSTMELDAAGERVPGEEHGD